MKEIIPNPTLKTLLEKAKAAHIVMDYVLIDCESVAVNAAVHKQAAIFALGVLAQQLDDYFLPLLQERNQKREDYFQIITEPDKARGEQISVQRFLGRAYDWQKQKIVSVWKISADNSRSKSGSNQGYAEAFSDTPYGIRINHEEANVLFEQINQAAFGGLQSELEIFEWSNDWSTYFNAGNEWWGSFLWTVKHPTQNLIVVIAASTTD